MSEKRNASDLFGVVVLKPLKLAVVSCFLLFIFVNKLHAQVGVPRVAISPDGSHFSYTYCMDVCGIAEVNIKTGDSKFYRLREGTLQAPSYSPDGTTYSALFIKQSGGKVRKIAIVNKINNTAFVVTNGPYHDFSPLFNKNGQSVVFSRASGTKSGRIPVTDFDAYSVDLINNFEFKKITDLRLGSMNNPVMLNGQVFFFKCNQ
jgi:hypothetical protein